MVSQFQLPYLSFNPAPSTRMVVDFNSYFATVEQQANPLLRGKPVAIAAYPTLNGCILAASREAKKLGVATGMRVRDGKALCPSLIVMSGDPDKYRYINKKLTTLLSSYTPDMLVASIDEMILNFENTPSLSRGLQTLGREIKHRIHTEIGDWMTVSVGIAPNRSLAKLASNLHKPDGLVEINAANFGEIFARLPVDALCGIAYHNTLRLHSVGIVTVMDMYRASYTQLRQAFQSILAYYWYIRLHGYEVDDVTWGRKSFGHSYALTHPTTDMRELSRILSTLVAKMGKRLRDDGYSARGIHLSCSHTDRTHWHEGHALSRCVYASEDLFREAMALFTHAPRKDVSILAVSCFDLAQHTLSQLTFFEDEEKKLRRTEAIDRLWNRFGSFTVFPGSMMGTQHHIMDRIAFGKSGLSSIPKG